jgi:hypothetical protein
MMIKVSDRFISIADIAIALVIFVTMSGITFPGSDDLANIPRLYQLQNTKLYVNDLVFKSLPTYYFFQYHIINAISYLISIKWAYLIFILMSHSLLLISLRKLALQLFDRCIPAIIFEIVLIGYMNTFIMADYCLTSNVFSPHYLSIAFSLQALACFIDSRHVRMSCLLFFAFLFHIQVGFYGALLIIFYWFWNIDLKRKIVFSGGAALVSIVFLWCMFNMNVDTGTMMLESAKIIAYARSPHHAIPSFWNGYELVNFLLIVLVFYLCWINGSQRQRQFIFSLTLLSILVIIYMACNTYLFNATVFYINAVEALPYILAGFYLLALNIIFEKNYAGYTYIIALFFILTSLELRILIVLVLLIIDVIKNVNEDTGSKSIFIKDYVATIIVISILYLKIILLDIQWNQKPWNNNIMWIVASLILLCAFLKIKRNDVRYIAIIIAVSFVFSGKYKKINWEYLPEPAWGKVATFASTTSLDTCFVIPPDKYDFQYLSYRSAFFTFKRLPSEIRDLPDWFSRSQMLLLFEPSIKPIKLDSVVRPNFDRYNMLTEQSFLEIKKRYPFVTHCIVNKLNKLSFPMIYENESYAIYRIL